MASSGTRNEKPIVYQIVNLVNGKFYIGVTRFGLRLRKQQHLSAARLGKLKLPIYMAIRKYGEHNFKFLVLCEFDTAEDALQKEIDLIAELKPAYNVTNGGEGNSYWLGKKRSPETNAKISRTKTGVPMKHTSPLMEKTRAENMRGASLLRRKPVRCVTDGAVFESAQAASLHYKFSKLAVAAVASGRRNRIYGLSFEYIKAQ